MIANDKMIIGISKAFLILFGISDFVGFIWFIESTSIVSSANVLLLSFSELFVGFVPLNKMNRSNYVFILACIIGIITSTISFFEYLTLFQEIDWFGACVRFVMLAIFLYIGITRIKAQQA